MGLFRAYRKFGGRLALFALALQFYLSFAHIHPDDIYGPVGQALSVAETVNLPAAESFKSIPAGQPWYSGDALCPICETIYFLSNSFTPDRADDPAADIHIAAGPALGRSRSALYRARGALRSNPALHPSPDPPRLLLSPWRYRALARDAAMESARGALQITPPAPATARPR